VSKCFLPEHTSSHCPVEVTDQQKLDQLEVLHDKVKLSIASLEPVHSTANNNKYSKMFFMTANKKIK